jgi:hypothetical protein
MGKPCSVMLTWEFIKMESSLARKSNLKTSAGVNLTPYYLDFETLIWHLLIFISVFKRHLGPNLTLLVVQLPKFFLCHIVFIWTSL